MRWLPRTRTARAAFIAAAGAGLFVSHVLSEFVPDALGIGLGMFCCGFLGGMLVGLRVSLSRPRKPHAP